MATKQAEKQRVIVVVECDTNRLYGTASAAAAYLHLIAEQYKDTDISLTEYWEGYENMRLQFEYSRDETDEELAERLASEKQRIAASTAMAERKAAWKEKQRQFDKLRRELGR